MSAKEDFLFTYYETIECLKFRLIHVAVIRNMFSSSRFVVLGLVFPTSVGFHLC